MTCSNCRRSFDRKEGFIGTEDNATCLDALCRARAFMQARSVIDTLRAMSQQTAEKEGANVR